MTSLRPLFIVPALIMVGSGVQLIRLFQQDLFLGSGKTFGALSNVSGDVKRRPLDRFRWFATQSGESLTDGESIRTAEGASTSIDIGVHGASGRIELGEQSLVVLKRSPGPSGKPRIQIVKGQVSLSKVKDTEIEVKGKVIQASNVTKGTVWARQGATIVQVQTGKMNVDDHLISAGTRWVAPQNGNIATGTRIATAAPPAPAPATAAPKPPATTVNTKTREVASKKSTIEVLPATPSPSGLEVNSGKGSTKLGASGDLNSLAIQLAWKPVEQAINYHVELFRSKSTPAPYASHLIEKPEFTLHIRSSKQLGSQYRILASLPEGKTAKSDRISIELEHAAPQPVVPAPQARVAVQAEQIFTWEKTVLTDKYEFQVARDPYFTKDLQSRSTPQNYLSLSQNSPGTFYWRVRSIVGGKTSGWSQKRALVVQ